MRIKEPDVMITRLPGFFLLTLLLFALPAKAEVVMVPNQTLVPFSFLENRDAGSLQEADQIPITVTEDVILKGTDGQDHVIFKKGQTGYAEVFYAAPPSHGAVSGVISIHYVYIPDVLGEEQKLRFQLKKYKKRGLFTTIMPLPVVPVVWAMKGKNVTLFDSTKPDDNQFEAQVMRDFIVNLSPTSDPSEPLPNTSSTSQNQANNSTHLQVSPATLTKADEKLLSNLQRRVLKQWRTSKPSIKKDLVGKVRYQINPQGELASLKVHQPSGNSRFDQTMLDTIETSAPFPEMIPFLEKSGVPYCELEFQFEISKEPY